MEKTKNNPAKPPAAPDVDPRFQKLLTLLALLKNARHKVKITELEFMMVNQTYNLVQYRHCVYWEWDGHDAHVKVASGLVHIDTHGPYAQWLQRVIDAVVLKTPLAKGPEEAESFVKIVDVTHKDCAPADAADWDKWVAQDAILVIFRDAHAKPVAGLWLDRDGPFGDLERAFLEDTADGYAGALMALRSEQSRTTSFFSNWKSRFFTRSKKQLAAAILLVALVFPVRISATAPVEIVAAEPYVISIPFEGTIKDVNVKPGQSVKVGDTLVTMDTTMLKNRFETAAMEMETAQVAYSKTQREAFGDRTKLSELAILLAQLEQKAAEKEFAENLLARAEIKAERDGVVIFSDVNALRGKPVQTGEQIMQLSDPKDNELLMRVPVDAMIEIQQDVAPTFFLNVSPLSRKEAEYISIGYQATADADGLMTYKVRARLTGGADDLRVGWTGTGKVYGARTLMVVSLLRRPMVTLRRQLGV